MFKRLVISLFLVVGLGSVLAQGPRQQPQVPDRWKVWYDDGSGSGLQLFHSDLDTWADIPSAPGIQVILTCEPPPDPAENVRRVPRRMVKSSNWYWLDAQGIPRQSRGSDGKPDGFPGTPLGDPPPEAQGRNPRGGITIDNETYENYRRMAVMDFGCELP